ncbi:DUF262 domain-containing protein, partial [Prosthecobacter sp.]|uniref:GmrSD restriction endonuclease domain-containing protein n=1 Tax=Prosthecobacter sp. TaxID=1965333 RepID=UPI0037C77B00
SLFRGWPFGSLLIWEVKPDCFAANEGIPHRAFWQVVDRTSEDAGSSASSLGQPATYHMVLDGQQRIQSLILALGGDQWGFQLNDADWALDLRDRRVRPSNHWSRASLCIDLERFHDEATSKGGKVRKIEAGKILDWIVLDDVAGQSSDPRPSNYVYPLLKASEIRGRFIRLSRVWDLAERDLSESEYEELLIPIFADHGATEATQSKVLRLFAQFMRVVENIKNNSFVHALQIESFQLTPQWTKDDYSDAIVNIFTRLNTAGRTLTREEITLAWLKVGWIREFTDGKTAGQCMDFLREAFAERGFELDTDEIVRLISFVWAVEHRDGSLLDSKDLLKGDIVRSLATTTAKLWNRLKPNLERGADLIKSRELPDKSFNAVIVVLSWYGMAFETFVALSGLSVIQRDDLEKHLRKRAEQFVDRWFFASEWAGVWGDAAVLSFQNFATDLNGIHKSFATCTAQKFLEVVDQSIAKLMDRIVPKAIQQVDNLIVKDRRRVHAYHNLLWVWHRLDADRWKYSSLPMRTGKKRTSKLEVDHTIADAWWQRIVNQETEEKLKAFVGTEAEKLVIGPDGYENLGEAQGFVNLLGNCSLLDKSFNISKSDKPMWVFLQEVHEFKNGVFGRPDWQTALLLDDTMTAPNGKTLAELKGLIQTRDAAIRIELKDFINGAKLRVDIQN